MATSVAGLLNEEGRKRWMLATLGLDEIRKLLIHCITAIMGEFHEKLLSDVSNKECQSCTNEDLARHNWTSVPGCKEVHDILLKAITQEHTQPNIPWSNTDVKLWTQLYWEVAKIYMQRGIKKKNKGPGDTDIANMLTMMDHCDRFRTGTVVKNRHRIQQVLAVRNQLYHSGTNYLQEEEMRDCFEKMLELLQDEYLQNRPNTRECTEMLKQIRASDYTVLPIAPGQGPVDWIANIDSLQVTELKALAYWIMVVRTESPGVLEQAGVPEEKMTVIRDLFNKLSNTK